MLWAPSTKPGCPFICIEPWCGIADRYDFEGDISERQYNHRLAPKESYAFNYSGKEIKKSDGNVSSGADKKWYLYRVNDFIKFLDANYSNKEETTNIATFQGKKGVIVFKDCGWSDATGHVDLYDGYSVEGSDYSNVAKKMYLYKIN